MITGSSDKEGFTEVAILVFVVDIAQWQSHPDDPPTTAGLAGALDLDGKSAASAGIRTENLGMHVQCLDPSPRRAPY